jgi:hypothetical protein
MSEAEHPIQDKFRPGLHHHPLALLKSSRYKKIHSISCLGDSEPFVSFGNGNVMSAARSECRSESFGISLGILDIYIALDSRYQWSSIVFFSHFTFTQFNYLTLKLIVRSPNFYTVPSSRLIIIIQKKHLGSSNDVHAQPDISSKTRFHGAQSSRPVRKSKFYCLSGRGFTGIY